MSVGTKSAVQQEQLELRLGEEDVLVAVVVAVAGRLPGRVERRAGERRAARVDTARARRERMARRLLPASMMGGARALRHRRAGADRRRRRAGPGRRRAGGRAAPPGRRRRRRDARLRRDRARRPSDPRPGGSGVGRPGTRPHRRARRRRARSASSKRRDLLAAIRTCSPTGTAGRTTTVGSSRSARRSRRWSRRRGPTSSTSTTGTPAPRSPPSTGRSRACCRCTTSPTRGSPTAPGCATSVRGARHYEWFGGTNPLSGAIALADAIVAVSPTHAKEILTPEGGFGLDGALRHRWDAVERDPQRHRHDGVGSGDRPGARGATTRRRTKTAERGAGPRGQPRRRARARGVPERRRAARRDGRPVDGTEGRRPARADRADPALDPAAPRRPRLGRGGHRRAAGGRGGRRPRVVLVRQRLRRAARPPAPRRWRPAARCPAASSRAG